MGLKWFALNSGLLIFSDFLKYFEAFLRRKKKKDLLGESAFNKQVTCFQQPPAEIFPF